MSFIKKYLIHILVSIITLLSGWSINLSLKTPIGAMPFKKQIQALKKKNKDLKAKHKTLLTKNNILEDKQKKIKKALKNHRKSSIKKLSGRVTTKIATAPTKAIPLIGIATIIGFTVTDIQGYCDDINDVKELEKGLFKETKEDLEDLEDEEIMKLCSQDYETIKDMILEKVF